MSTTQERMKAQKRRGLEEKLFDEVDGRFGSSHFLQEAFDKIFPDHWSFMVGEIAMWSLVVLIITGVYLALFYIPSGQEVVYHGSYLPLDGQKVTLAYQSVLNISFDVRGGLVMRQMHHWAAIVFLAALLFHMCRVFFTGAFRRPREINWIIGFTLLMVSVFEGFTGYSLPDDLLSGTGLRVVFSIMISIPLVGTWIGFDLLGSQWPGTQLLNRLFIVHEFLFPALIVGLLSAHLAILWRQKHTDFPGPGKTETNIRGSRFFPQYMLKGGALMMIIFGVIGALGGLVQINPIWLYGPYNPFSVSEGSQPDIYAGWLDGLVRLWPHWEFRSWGHEIANPFFPGVLVVGIISTIAAMYPVIDRKMYKDYRPHNLLDRPRDKPGRTAIGAAGLAFISVATIASADDLLANDFHISYERMLEICQALVILGPIIAAFTAYKACKALQRRDSHPIQKPIGGIIVRHANGSYHTLGDTHHAEHEGDGHGNGHAADEVHAGNGHSANGHDEDGHGAADEDGHREGNGHADGRAGSEDQTAGASSDD
jgi:ubiquinol-cytochrome c reductase cytochrome b subunit